MRRNNQVWIGRGVVVGMLVGVGSLMFGAVNSRADTIYWAGKYIYATDVASGTTTTLIKGTGSNPGGNNITSPTALAIGPEGDIYVGNGYDDAYIVKVTPTGVPSNFAQDPSLVTGLAFDQQGNLYASEYAGQSVGRFAPDGTETLFAAGLNHPGLESFDNTGNLYVLTDQTAATSGSTAIKVTPSGAESTFATGVDGLYWDCVGDLYTGTASGAVTLTTPSGVVSPLAAGFSFPIPLGEDSRGDLYIYDAGTFVVDTVSPSGAVKQVASVPDAVSVVIAVPEPWPISLVVLAPAFLARRGRRIRGLRIRCARQANLSFEQLDRRVLLSIPTLVTGVPYTSVTTGAVGR